MSEITKLFLKKMQYFDKNMYLCTKFNKLTNAKSQILNIETV